MKTVLIHYKEWVDATHPLLDSEYVKRSKVLEVLNLTDLNSMFGNITKIEVISEQCNTPNVSQQRELLLAYNEEINQYMVDGQDILNETDVDEFLANYCG